MIERFRRSLESDGRVMYEYYVTGRGQFPYDMLRYDACWPVTSADAVKLDTGPSSGYGFTLRSILMHSYRAPTVDRWTSFLWSVGLENMEPKS